MQTHARPCKRQTACAPHADLAAHADIAACLLPRSVQALCRLQCRLLWGLHGRMAAWHCTHRLHGPPDPCLIRQVVPRIRAIREPHALAACPSLGAPCPSPRVPHPTSAHQHTTSLIQPCTSSSSPNWIAIREVRNWLSTSKSPKSRFRSLSVIEAIGTTTVAVPHAPIS